LDRKKYLITALVLIVATTNIDAQDVNNQDSTKVFYYRGRVVDGQNKPLVYAHVINLLRGHATITDSTGYFKIPVVINDSLKISSIGFYTRIIHVSQKRVNDTAFHVLILQKREYDLPTVDIYEIRWQVFKSEFMEEVVEEDKTAKRISNWMSNLISTEELKMIYQSTMVPGFAINYKSKAERSKKKVAAMEKKYQLIAPKFNDKMIGSLTGLEGDAIYKFLRFCNFDERFLIHATEYEIMEKVLNYWEEYKRQGLDKAP